MNSDPHQIAQLHAAAQEAMRRGNLKAAHAHCLAILKLDQTFADAWFLCGVIAAHNAQPAKALEILEKAIALAPDNPEYRAELGKRLLATHQPERALLEAEAALCLHPAQIPTLNTLGTVFSHAGEHEKALGCYERAADSLRQCSSGYAGLSAEWRADLYCNLAASLQFAGRFEESERAYEEAIALRPAFFKAHSALSTLRRQTVTSNHLKRLENLRNKVSSPRDQLHLGHAIAKEQEDLGLYEDAFRSLAWAKQRQAEARLYNAEADTRLFEGIRRLFTRERFEERAAGCDSREPIFIVGMPRTGTTLVEQILSSHSRVFAAGELQHFPLQVKRLTRSTAAGLLDLRTLEMSMQLAMSQLGSAYVESTRPRTGHTPHFIDKLPLNFMFLGLIRLALPNAKIVCLRRDPMDTCLSNYRQVFAGNFQYYQYNLDLLDCGRYFIEFDRTMRHWHELMPGHIFEVHYDTLVESPEPQARALLTHCGLPWEEQCLAFHQRKTSVATPSAVQVRQGIYTSSLNRWRRYGDAMLPLYELLKSAGFYP
ncbi:MAG: sulfotransferase [Haliea sp.]|nr:sulfotransferase [Haliea sp.]